MQRIYRVNPAARLHWREWDGQHVVYDDASGDTHLLDDFGTRLVHRLGGAPQRLDELAAACADERGVTVDGALAYEVKAALDRLVVAGLLDIARA